VVELVPAVVLELRDAVLAPLLEPAELLPAVVVEELDEPAELP
jgi:hypothetical protein